MARTRSIKPAFFKNEILASLPYQDRLLFAGLWTLADREGRLEDRPVRIRAELFPYDHEFDIEGSLCRLAASRFINRYSTVNGLFIEVNTFKKHQSPHHTEAKSVIDSPLVNGYATVNIPPSTLNNLIPSTLPPGNGARHDFSSQPLDEQFTEYRELFEQVGNPIPEEFQQGSFAHRAWSILDYYQRQTVIDSLRERKAAGVTVMHKPDTYITKGEYKRKIKPHRNGTGNTAEELAAL